MNMSRSELLLMFMLKIVLLITFFVLIFLQLFQRIWNQREILRLLIPLLILKQNVIVGGHCMQTA